MRAVVLAALIVFQSAAGFAQPVKDAPGDMTIGTTFSVRQCEYLGLDWEKTYVFILEMGFDIVRLGAYWSEIEKEKGVYDFSRLDRQISEAGKRGIPVVLVVGMKAPRWPEFHIPDWVLGDKKPAFGADISRDPEVNINALRFVEKAVTRYKENKAVKYWQVENEPLNKFGTRHWYICKKYLAEEVELVRKLDGTRPVVLTAATYPNAFLAFISRYAVAHDPIKESLKLCDVLGINVYPVVGHGAFGMKFYFRSGAAKRKRYFQSLRRQAAQAGKKVWIVEFQAEPWEPGELVHKRAEEAASVTPEEVRTSFTEFASLGFDTVFLWGAEYWLFRSEEHGDERWIDAAKDILKKRR